MVEAEVKAFPEQFRECAAALMHGEGPVLGYAIHSGLTAHDPAQGKFFVAKEMELPTVGCLRFGGICSGGKEECQRLRKGD